MSTPTTAFQTPSQRLAESRRAITEHLRRHDRRADSAQQEARGELAGDGTPPSSGWWAVIKHAAGVWWRHHPAHLALEVATPALQSYAEERPVRMIAVAAAVGASAMVLRPWRLISITGLAVAMLKSSELSGVLLSLLSMHNENNHKEEPR